MMDRKPVFAAARAEGADFSRPGHIQALDNALTFMGFPVDGEKHINDAGLDLIKQFEGLELTAYRDSVGVLTIGYGHTGPDVKEGMKITEAQADALLREDVTEAEDAVSRLCPVTTDNQFSALVSFTFNLGEGNLASSTLRAKHNAGDYAGAQAEFGRWVYAGGVKLNGLVKRRDAEAELYGTP